MANLLEIIVRAKDEASKTLEKVGRTTKDLAPALQVAGAAMLGVGVAGMKMASDARRMNAELGYTGRIINVTTEEMREMALAITDVTFGIKSVAATFELLARAGVTDQETMKKNALAFDALADATRSEAQVVADILIPAYKMFGEQLPKTAREVDKWTYLVTTTNVALTDMGGLMGYVATYGRDLNLTSEQLVIMMKAMAEQGRSAADAARLLRTAINQAGGSTEKLYELLGITREEISLYTKDLYDHMGVTQDLQEQQETQYTLLERLKQKWQELELQLAPVLEALEPIFAIFTALGPLLLSASLVMPKLSLAFHRLRAAMVGVQIQAIAMWGAITLGVSVAIAGIVELVGAVKEGDRQVEEYNRAWEDLADTMKADVQTAANSMIRNLQTEQDALVTAINDRRALWKTTHWERMSQLTDQFIAELRALAPEAYLRLFEATEAGGKSLYEQWQDTTEAIETTREALDRLRIAEIQDELRKGGQSQEEILRLQLELQQLRLPSFDRQFAEIMSGISEEDIDKYFDPQVKEIEAQYAKMLAPFQTLWEDEFNTWGYLWGLAIDASLLTYEEKFAAWKPKLEALWAEAFPGIPAPEYEVPEPPPAVPQAYNIVKPFLDLIGITREEWDEWHRRAAGLQAGGLVMRPTRAIIAEREPEAVIPLSKMGMGTVTVNVGYLMGDDVSLRRFVRYLQQMMGEEARRTQFGQVQSGYFYGRSAI